MLTYSLGRERIKHGRRWQGRIGTSRQKMFDGGQERGARLNITDEPDKMQARWCGERWRTVRLEGAGYGKCAKCNLDPDALCYKMKIMKRHFLASVVLFLPAVAFALQASEELIKKSADVIFEGTVSSISSQVSYHKTRLITSHITNAIPCTSAMVLVAKVLKGAIPTNSTVTVYYENKQENGWRCPPFVDIKQGDVGTFSVNADFSKGVIRFYLQSGEFFKRHQKGQTDL